MNPYDTLGVPSDATPKQIKDAFRARAKEHHPDVGGDAEKFRNATLAYAILSDPDKRKVYDETGDIGLANNWDAAVNEALSNLVLAALLDEVVDVTKTLKGALKQNENGVLESIRKINKKIAKIKVGVSRISRVDGEKTDPLFDFLSRQISALEGQKEQEDNNLKLVLAVSARLDHYTFKEGEKTKPERRVIVNSGGGFSHW